MKGRPMETRPITKSYEWLNAFSRDPQLSDKAVCVAVILFSHMSSEGVLHEDFTPGYPKIAKRRGWSAQNVNRDVGNAVKELEAAGYLIVTRRRGYKITNLYEFTVPAQASLVTPLPKEDESEKASPVTPKVPVKVSSVNRKGVARDTQSSPSTQNPNPGNGNGTSKTKNKGITDEERATAGDVLDQVTNRLPNEEGAVLIGQIKDLKQRDTMARRIVRLVNDGWRDALVDELTRKEHDWSETPYAGARMIGVAAAARVRDFDKRYPGPKTTRDVTINIATMPTAPVIVTH